MKTKKICVATTVHTAFDTRIYFKQVLTLSQRYHVDYYAPFETSSVSVPKPSGAFIPLFKAASKSGRARTIYQLFRLLSLSSYDVYHFHDPELIPVAIFLRLRNKTVIFDMHEDISGQIKNKEWLPAIVRRVVSPLFLLIEKSLPALFNHIILAEDSYMEKYKNSRNITVIHNYPVKNINYKKEKYDFDTFKMVYTGDMRRVRGIMEYIKILNLCKVNNLKVQLIFIGSIPDKELANEVKLYIKEYNLENDIIFYGRMPNDKIYSILRDADLGLSLMHPIKNYVSSYPTKMFEYMSVGLPALVSNFPLWEEVVYGCGCGFSVSAFDIEGAVNIIKKYYNDINLRIEHGSNGFKLITERYNWDAEAVKLFEVYENG